MSEKLKGKVERSGNSSSEAKECGLPLEKLNLGPRKKLLVLSLGGLLCHRDQVKCTDSGFKTLEKRDKPLFLKELKKVWEGKCSKTRSSSTGKYSSSNTLLMDNQPYKALLNPPHTAICPAEYKVDQVDDMALGE
ncbi:PREDICTED: ubiquitin domain-containing [Prunus dulcis]|uniref:PREDICTED: ubiquitin domain-containing n=1 Tax=Prunus dulcis TaxID=3755 RepID=A0A5E4G7J8_PRUDU|nr:PREDICTED: ubiquitin domain-containing [Prunus dulcis]